MQEKFNSNSFAPFLETIIGSSSAGPTEQVEPITILYRLAENPDSRMDVPSLFSASALPLNTFANAMNEFKAAGLVATQTQSGREMVSLTSTGEQVARIKR